MAGLFGASPGVAQAASQAGAGLANEMNSLGLFAQPRQRRGLFGGRVDPLQLQQMLAMAQAAMAGDYGAMGQMASSMARGRREQDEAESEAEAVRQLRTHGYQALRSRGVDGAAIGGMLPQDLSRAVAERISPFTLSPNQERVTPGGPGQQEVYRSAPEPTAMERTVEYLRSQGATPEFIDAYIQNEAIRPQWVTPPAGGFAQDVTPQVSLRGGAMPPSRVSDSAPPPPPGFEIDQPQGGPGQQNVPATFPDPRRYPPGQWF